MADYDYGGLLKKDQGSWTFFYIFRRLARLPSHGRIQRSVSTYLHGAFPFWGTFCGGEKNWNLEFCGWKLHNIFCNRFKLSDNLKQNKSHLNLQYWHWFRWCWSIGQLRFPRHEYVKFLRTERLKNDLQPINKTEKNKKKSKSISIIV